MDITATEKAILERFEQKMRIAGGPRAGYMLRKQAIATGPAVAREGGTGGGLDEALSALVERGLLKVNEAGNLYYLTAEGVSALEADGTG